jgi:type III secretion protein J
MTDGGARFPRDPVRFVRLTVTVMRAKSEAVRLPVLVLAILAMLLGACSSDVASGLSEDQAQEALAALSRAGVAATREAEAGEGQKAPHFKLVVPTADVGRAAEVLRSEGLPRPPARGFAETYASPGMIPSPTEEHARYLKALSGEIAAQLERFESVIHASVIVTMPVPDPLAPPDVARGKPSASVLLKLRAGSSPPAEADVKRLVAAAVEGLAPDGVAIVTEAMPKPPEATTSFTTLAGIHVAQGSKTALVGLLAGALALLLAMGTWMLVGSRRRTA